MKKRKLGKRPKTNAPPIVKKRDKLSQISEQNFFKFIAKYGITHKGTVDMPYLLKKYSKLAECYDTLKRVIDHAELFEGQTENSSILYLVVHPYFDVPNVLKFVSDAGIPFALYDKNSDWYNPEGTSLLILKLEERDKQVEEKSNV